MASAENNPVGIRDLALLSWIQQLAPYGVFTLDTSLRLQSWNRWMESHSQLAGAEVAGQALFELFPELESRRLTTPFLRALEGESSVLSTALHHYLLPLKSPLNSRAGDWMRQTARVAPLLAGGKVCGVIVVIEDVTQREIQAESLGLQHRRDEALSWALIHFLKSDEPRKTVRQVFFKIAEHLDFDTFFLYLREPDSGAVRLYAAGGVSDEMQACFLECGILAKVADQPEPVFLEAIKNAADPEYALLKSAKISAAIAIPLRVKNNSLGVLCFASWSRERIAPEESDLLTTIAQYLATAVDKENTNRQLRRIEADRKSAEEQLAESYEREKLAREKAESANRAKDDFLAALSHELRTPLNPILLIASDASENTALAPEVRAQFDTIRKNIELEARLIDDLLDVTRITHGKLSLHLRVMDLKVILDETIRNIRPELDEKAIRLGFDFKAGHRYVRGDDVRLQQVFWNILKNAVKFTPKGGSIAVVVDVAKSHLRISITDSGIGIAPGEVQRIFEAFSQGDHAKNDAHRFGGLGLGLAIARKLVEMHHGEIQVASEGLDKGATFTILLPMAEPEASQLQLAVIVRPDAVPKPPRTDCHILLVEDHEPTRTTLSLLLSRRGFQVVAAGNSSEAREASAREKFDLVISDIGLPDGSGLELMKYLSTHVGLKGIALTGYGMEEDIGKCLAAGFATHLIKPIKINALVNALETLLQG